jgi:hypothetical protein
MRVPTTTVHVIILLVVVGAVVVVMFVAGWADDRAEPGSGGRVPVPTTATPNSP